MFAVDVCRLPATGGSIFVLVAGLFLLATGAIVTRWVRQSAGRLSVVVAPLVLLGGLALTPQVTDPCMPPTTIGPTTTAAPDATASPTTTVAPDSTASPTTTAAPESVFSNDDVVHAYNMSTAETGTWTGDTTLATVEVGEPGYGDGPYATVWFKWVATTDGSLIVDSCDTSFDSVLKVYSISDILDPWDNDVSYEEIEEDDSSAPDSCGGDDPARIVFAVSAGDSYYIQLDGYDANGFGPAQLNWQFTVGVRPTNDDVVDAFELTGSGSWTGDTTLATVEGGSEPFYDDCSDADDGCEGPYATVWFKWVATTDGSLVVDSCDTAFDSVLKVYSISDILDPWDNDVFIDEDDSSAPESCGGDDPARLTVAVSAGDTYYIQLDGYDEDGFGPAQLNWQFFDPNDDVVDAFELTGSGFWTGDTTAATVEVGEPVNDDPPNATVWFKWVATTDGLLVIDSCETSFDSFLAAFSISDIEDPWNNDVFIDADSSSASCDAYAAELTFAVNEGDTYYIQLGSVESRGPAQLNWTFTIPV